VRLIGDRTLADFVVEIVYKNVDLSQEHIKKTAVAFSYLP